MCVCVCGRKSSSSCTITSYRPTCFSSVILYFFLCPLFLLLSLAANGRRRELEAAAGEMCREQISKLGKVLDYGGNWKIIGLTFFNLGDEFYLTPQTFIILFSFRIESLTSHISFTSSHLQTKRLDLISLRNFVQLQFSRGNWTRAKVRVWNWHKGT